MNRAVAAQNMNKQNPRKNTTHAMMRRLLSEYMGPYWGQLLLATFFMAIGAAMTAAVAQMMQPVLDDVLSGDQKHLIVPVASALFGVLPCAEWPVILIHSLWLRSGNP